MDCRPRRQAPGQRTSHARHRAVGRPRDRQPSRRPGHRDRPRQGRDRVGQAGRGQDRIRQAGEIPDGAAGRRRQGHRAERRGRRRNARLGSGARSEDGQGIVALVRRAQARRPGQRNLERRPQRLENRRRRNLANGLLRPGDPSLHRRHGQPGPDLRSAGAPGDNLYTDSAVALNVDTGKPAWHFQYTPNDSWDYDEVGVHMLYDATVNGEQRKIVGHFGRNGFYYTLDRTNGKFIKADQYVNDLNWTKGISPKTGRPLDYDPKLDVQIYNPIARALRGDGKKRACPTWHGGVAHQPTAYHPVKKIAYGVGIEGCFTQNAAAVVFKSKDGDVDAKASEKRE